jgi:putative ABC transport system permease protein
VEAALKDFKFALRSLLKQPGFTAVAVITLMLAIGVNTTIFSVVNAVLLRALPFRSPEQLVAVYKPPSGEGLPGLAAYQYLAWHDKQTSFEDLGAYSEDSFNLTGLGEPERITSAEVTTSFFNTLGVRPARGRTLAAVVANPGPKNLARVGE